MVTHKTKLCTNISLNAVCSNPDFLLRIFFVPSQISVHIKGPIFAHYAIFRLESKNLFQAEALEIRTRMDSGSNTSRSIRRRVIR